MPDGINEQYAALLRLLKQQDELYHRIAAASGLSDAAFWVLYALCENETALSQQELCSAWCYPKQTVNSAIQNLCRLGYVALAAGEGKRKNVLLTAAGQAFCQNTTRPLQKAERDSFARLAPAEREAFLSLFRRQLQSLQEETTKAQP